ncbi:hypothetical protein RND71_021855 [Anisodus tanguticus]|uniref:Uncharacterized protein n=1 Tax=Anisodus tanguticus TaxID=243964 RepID=A0AAE1RXC9_9SOLA|nr:hypothetical protein RND71_021855 [Anisodus tanguticus]
MASRQSELSSSSSSLPKTRWWSKETVAIVTGANKGIGFALVKRMAELGLTVILTARDNTRGMKAIDSLNKLGLHVYYHQLDVSDTFSIQAFTSWFANNFTALDILVNNAAISFNDIHENSVEHAETKLRNEEVRNMLLDEENISEKQIEGLVNLFVENVKDGTWKSKGWPELWTDYAVSKLALNAYSIVLARDYKGKGISVNCYCPGFTQTSMTGGKGKYTAQGAAEIGVILALLPPLHLPTGKFYLGSNPPNIYSKI